MKRFELIGYILFFIMLALLLAISSCSTGKKVVSHKEKYDSSYFKSIVDSNRILSTNLKYLKETHSKENKSTVKFVDKKCPICPKIELPKGIDLSNKDSVEKLIYRLNNSIETQNNLSANQENIITQYANGNVEYRGQIKSYKSDVKYYSQIIDSLSKIIDSIYFKNQIETESKSTTNEKVDINKKTTFLPWWLWAISAILIFFIIIVSIKSLK